MLIFMLRRSNGVLQLLNSSINSKLPFTPRKQVEVIVKPLQIAWLKSPTEDSAKAVLIRTLDTTTELSSLMSMVDPNGASKHQEASSMELL